MKEKRISVMKVNSICEGGVEKITQRKGCFVLSLERQKSIQTQQPSHHGLTASQPRETQEEFSEINISLVFVFSSNLLLLMSFLNICPRTWKQTLWLQEISLWISVMQGLLRQIWGSLWRTLRLGDGFQELPSLGPSQSHWTNRWNPEGAAKTLRVLAGQPLIASPHPASFSYPTFLLDFSTCVPRYWQSKAEWGHFPPFCFFSRVGPTVMCQIQQEGKLWGSPRSFLLRFSGNSAVFEVHVPGSSLFLPLGVSSPGQVIWPGVSDLGPGSKTMGDKYVVSKDTVFNVKETRVWILGLIFVR